MRKALVSVLCLLLLESAAAFGALQADKLEGKWAGTVNGIQGQRPAVATFKKEHGAYTGTISGMRPGADAPLKDIKIEGEKVTAKTEVDTGQAVVVVNYSFVLDGDSLKGKGEVEFGGQTYAFNFDLKRGAEMPAAAAAEPAQQQPQRREVPQPQQKQSANYFVGEWNFKWTGRESPLGPAPREGTSTFTLRSDGKTIDVRTAGTADGAQFNESAVIIWDESSKSLTMSERLANGAQIQSKGDWSSPIAIRFTVDPIKVKGQTLQLKRIISVVAAHSFTVTEELSENGGPFLRLGNAIYTKVGAK